VRVLAQTVDARGQVDHRVVAGDDPRPVGGLDRARRTQGCAWRHLTIRAAHSRGDGAAVLEQTCADRPADEAARAGDEDRTQNHRQPCFEKKVYADWAKSQMCRKPFLAAWPPWWTMRTDGT